jgi:hypothetical protein
LLTRMPEPRRLHITSVIFSSKWKNEFDQFARKESGHTASALICTRELDQKKGEKNYSPSSRSNRSPPATPHAPLHARAHGNTKTTGKLCLRRPVRSKRAQTHTHTHKSAHRIEGPFHDGHWAIGLYTHKCRSQKSGPRNVHTARFELEPELSVWFQVLRRTSSFPSPSLRPQWTSSHQCTMKDEW